MNPIEETKLQIEGKNTEIRQWHELFRNEGWKKIEAFLKSEYCEVSEDDYSSMKKLAALQAKRKLIRNIFAQVDYTYQERAMLEDELRQFIRDEDEIPTKEIPHMDWN